MKKILLAVTLTLLSMAAVFAQQLNERKYLEMRPSEATVIKNRFNGDAESYRRLAESPWVKDVAERAGTTVNALINLIVRDYAYNPNGDKNTLLWKLFDPCKAFDRSLDEVVSLVKERAAWLAWLDTQISVSSLRVFAKALDCPPGVPDSVCVKRDTRDTIVFLFCFQKDPAPTPPEEVTPEECQCYEVVVTPLSPQEEKEFNALFRKVKGKEDYNRLLAENGIYHWNDRLYKGRTHERKFRVITPNHALADTEILHFANEAEWNEYLNLLDGRFEEGTLYLPIPE